NLADVARLTRQLANQGSRFLYVGAHGVDCADVFLDQPQTGLRRTGRIA
ncbi:hypothetical protein Pgy4_35793, partial [Pseudomonas savastanoi pv. glycinea str. race 4]